LLNPGQQALLVYPGKGEPLPGPVRGVDHDVLAVCQRNGRPARGAGAQAARRAPSGEATGMAYVIIDGTSIPIDRIAVDRPFCSGKHKRHG
jgi:hypothetical protein